MELYVHIFACVVHGCVKTHFSCREYTRMSHAVTRCGTLHLEKPYWNTNPTLIPKILIFTLISGTYQETPNNLPVYVLSEAT